MIKEKSRYCIGFIYINKFKIETRGRLQNQNCGIGISFLPMGASNNTNDFDRQRLGEDRPTSTSKKDQKRRPPKNNRTVVEDVLWILRTGTPWRDLPKDFGKWKTVYTRFRRWSLNGVWESIWGILKKKNRTTNHI